MFGNMEDEKKSINDIDKSNDTSKCEEISNIEENNQDDQEENIFGGILILTIFGLLCFGFGVYLFIIDSFIYAIVLFVLSIVILFLALIAVIKNIQKIKK